MITINKSKIKLVIYLFFFIFAPPLIPRISIIHILTAGSLLYMLLYWRTSLKLFYRQRNIKAFFTLFLIYLLYIVSRMAYSIIVNPVNADNYVNTLYKFFMVVIEIPICCAFIIIYCNKKSYSFDELLKMIVWTGIIQVVIGGLMIVSPSIKYSLVSFMQRNNGSSISDIVPWEYNRRYNAISDCMLDMLGWGLGIISALPLYLKGKKRYMYLLCIPFLVVITVANSTTGIIMFAILAVIAILGKIKKISNNKVIIIGVSFLVAIGAVIAMKYIVPSTYDWTVNEIKAILGMNTEKVSSFSKVMSSDFRIFPEQIIELVFGTGHTIYSVSGFAHSDLGYINHIWLGGLFGTIGIYFIYFILFKAGFKKQRKAIVLSLAIAMYIFELKGFGICYNPGMALTMLLVFDVIIVEKKYECDAK